MVESSALLKRRTSKGYRGFESLPHRHFFSMHLWRKSAFSRWFHANDAALRAKANAELVVVERPDQKHLQLEVCCNSEKRARRLVEEFGGRIEKLPRDWLKRFAHAQRRKPIKIGKRLIITNVGGTSVSRLSRHQGPSHIIIPAGAAFGTGEHATTAMSLRLLEEVSRRLKPEWSTRLRKPTAWQVVDLGTGSGILALAAKRFGAQRVIAIDNDARAIATARANARTNKIDNVDFRVGDVRHWKFPRKIDIVTANLFSGLLIEILPKLKQMLKRDGRIILSGVLRNQERELRRALRLCKIDIVQARRRGKWVAVLARAGT